MFNGTGKVDTRGSASRAGWGGRIFQGKSIRKCSKEKVVTKAENRVVMGGYGGFFRQGWEPSPVSDRRHGGKQVEEERVGRRI